MDMKIQEKYRMQGRVRKKYGCSDRSRPGSGALAFLVMSRAFYREAGIWAMRRIFSTRLDGKEHLK